MDLCNDSCSFIQPDGWSCMAKTLTFCTTLTDLDLAWGSQSRGKIKPIGFIFSHNCDLIRMKFDVVMKQFKLNILRLLLSKIYWNKGNNCCFYWLCEKTLTLACIWIYTNQFWFKLGMTIGTVETCWCAEPHTHFITSILYSRGRTLLIWFLLFFFLIVFKFSISLHLDIYKEISFKLGLMIQTIKLYILVSCLDDLYLH